MIDISAGNNLNDPLAGYSYSHDAVGNRTGRSSQLRNDTYTYDPTYQLSRAVKQMLDANGQVEKTLKEQYSYDAVGNREVGLRPSVPTVYDDMNQLLSNRQFTYQYDISGNLTAKSPIPPVTADGDTETETGFTYEWNDENQLTRVVRTTSKQVITSSYKYDPFGRRIEKRVAITTLLTARTSVKIHTYLYDQEDIVQEIITKPRPRRDIVETTSFVHGPGIDEPLAFSGPQGEYFFHADGLGSISALTDHTGAVVQRYEYSTFGTRKKYDTGADTFYSYTGREWDSETGLYYYRARYYDPQVGRFISRDPIGFAGGDVNVYRYVGNNPVNAVDPWGLYDVIYSPTAGELPDARTQNATQCLADCLERNIVVTGAREGGHSTGSAHETGQACDVGERSNPELEPISVERCFNDCSGQDGFVWGQHEPRPPHYHMQTRPGRGGATGFVP